jgi:hypothetical protein
MGWSHSNFSYAQRAAAEKEDADRRAEFVAKTEALVVRKRMALADKITMVIIDRVVADIIRPGPVAEERECYDVAKELRDAAPRISEIVAGVLKVEKEEGGK